MQRLNRDTDIENKNMNTKGERVAVGGVGRLGLIYILLILCTCCAQASLVGQLVKNQPAMQETPVNSWVGKIL